jgi:predicted transcriptional regulator
MRVGNIVDDLNDAIVVEVNRDTAGTQIHGHTIAQNCRARMIHLETISARKLYGKWVERLAVQQRNQKFVEMFLRHTMNIITRRLYCPRG